MEENRSGRSEIFAFLCSALAGITFLSKKEENVSCVGDLTGVNGPPCKNRRSRKITNIGRKWKTYTLDNEDRYEERVRRHSTELINHYVERDMKKKQIVMVRCLEYKYIPEDKLSGKDEMNDKKSNNVDAEKRQKELSMELNQFDIIANATSNGMNIPESLDDLFNEFDFELGNKKPKIKVGKSRIFKFGRN